MELITPCNCDKDEFSSKGCWYARKEPGQKGYTCSQPCVIKLVEENEELKKKLESAQQRLADLRAEVG